MLSSTSVDRLSGSCRITHGPNDSYFENLTGKPVALVRRCLATAFGIPDEAEPWVGGSVVGADYRLRAGDSVEFLVRLGRKGALEPEELARLERLEERLAEVEARLSQTELSELLSLREAWERLFHRKVSLREVSKLYDSGEITGPRIGRRKLVWGESVLAYLRGSENTKPPLMPQEQVEPPHPNPVVHSQKRKQSGGFEFFHLP